MAEPLLTRYRMLKSTDSGKTWTMEGDQDAHNGDAALKKFFGIPEAGVQVVAVTERSWRPAARAKRVVETDVLGAVDQTPEPIPGQTAITPDGDVEVPPEVPAADDHPSHLTEAIEEVA
jgi:hypothetical protein